MLAILSTNDYLSCALWMLCVGVGLSRASKNKKKILIFFQQYI